MYIYPRDLIHETDLRGKLRPKPKFATIGQRLQFMRTDNAKLPPKLETKLVKFTLQLEVDYTLGNLYVCSLVA